MHRCPDNICDHGIHSPIRQDLLNKMLEPNPAKRISLADILAHPWTNGGQTMSPQALSAEMARRKAFIDAEKSKERLKDRAKHAGALSDAIDRGLEVDAFGPPVAAPAPPPLPAAHAGLCDFRTAVAPAEALAAMAHVLRLRESTADVQTFASEHRLTARVVTATAGIVELTAQIFRESESASASAASEAGAEQAYIVQVKKVRGDAFAFRTLHSLLEHELTHAAFVDSTPESRLTADELSAFREATAQASAF
jgi:hypothetical protein